MTREQTTAIVLCGGRGTRMGGEDKPLLDLGGKTLIAHVIERLSGQVDAVVLSCGGRASAYRQFDCPVVLDQHPDQGPLGGFVSTLPRVATPWLLTMPCDVPFLPTNLVVALAPSCRRRGATVAAAGGRRQNLALLLDRRRAQSLATFFARGERAIRHWLDENQVAAVEFPVSAFHNINTPADLAAARQRVAQEDRQGWPH